MRDVIEGLRKEKVPDDTRETLYRVLIPAMQDRDWDTETECMDDDEVYDKVLRSLHPEWFDEDDEWEITPPTTS